MMNNQMLCDGMGCWTWGLVWGAAWFVIASLLLHTTWNRVVVALTGARVAKVWHAFLVVITLIVLCAPGHYKRGQCNVGCKWRDRKAAIQLPTPAPEASPPVPAE